MASYIPDTLQIQKEMLKEIGLDSFDELYSMVPKQALAKDLNLPLGKSEYEVGEIIKDIANKNKVFNSIFRGAGAYKHYIPSIVKSITSKEEFLTAYTPYQAEISQGVLQSIFEYQSQICELTGMDVSNASVYDGAVACAEAIMMCIDKNLNEVIIAGSINPEYLTVINTYCESRDVKVVLLDNKYHTELSELKEKLNEHTAAVLVQSPNYYGIIEDTQELVSETHNTKAKFIEVFNPISLGLLKSPGEMNVDIAVAEGQVLGLPISFGGPYLGIMACKKEMMRKLPGRIVGETIDSNGNRAFVLTLQAREQHIRREKASSNVCSNEALCALTASIYLAALGPKGLKKVAQSSFNHCHYLLEELEKIEGFKRINNYEFFNEVLTSCPIDPKVLENKLAQKNILMGLIIDNNILWATTELNTKEKIDELINVIKEVI